MNIQLFSTHLHDSLLMAKMSFNLSLLCLICRRHVAADDPAALLETLVCGAPPLPLPGSIQTPPKSTAGDRRAHCSQVPPSRSRLGLCRTWPYLNQSSFELVVFHREVLRCTMITHQVLLRGAAQCFLLNGALRLTDVVRHKQCVK